MSRENLNRIAVIGISGSGKSTFSRALSTLLKIPLYHMDSLFWNEGWQEVSPDVWSAQEKTLLSRPQWIVEGYIDPAYPERLGKADLVIYLDFNGMACIWNGLKRWWIFRGKSREELPGCPESLRLSFLWVMLLRKERPGIERALAVCPPRRIVRLKNHRETADFLKESACRQNTHTPSSREGVSHQPRNI